MDSMDLENTANNGDKRDHDKEIVAIKILPEVPDSTIQKNETNNSISCTINYNEPSSRSDLDFIHSETESDGAVSLSQNDRINQHLTNDLITTCYDNEDQEGSNLSLLDIKHLSNVELSSSASVNHVMAPLATSPRKLSVDNSSVMNLRENQREELLTYDSAMFSDWTPDSPIAEAMHSMFDVSDSLSLSASSSNTSSPAYKSSASSSPLHANGIANDQFPFIPPVEDQISISQRLCEFSTTVTSDIPSSESNRQSEEELLKMDDKDLVTVNLANSNDNFHNCLFHPDYLKLKEKLDESNAFQSECLNKIASLEKKVQTYDSLQSRIILLEQTIAQQEKELDTAKEEHDSDVKLLSTLKKENEMKIEVLKKKYDQANKEKESMVMRYAKSEKEVMDLKKEKDLANKKFKDSQKELDSLMVKLKVITSDKSKLAQTLDNKNMELSTATKEVERLKEEINSRDIKIKWVQNKVKTEMDLHKECPVKMERLTERIAELEKEIENYQEEIECCKKNFQDYEANKILENQLKEEQAKLILERHEQTERETKLKTLQVKNTSLIEENNSLSFQVQNLELDRIELEKKLSIARIEAQESSNSVADLKARLVEFDSISNQLAQEREKVEKVVSEVERLRRTNEELMQDMASCRSREAEMLSFTQKLTTKNVQLQSEFSSVEAKAGKLSHEQEKYEEIISNLKKEVETTRTELEEESKKRNDERRLLARQVAEKTAKCEELESQLSDAKSQASGLKHKHQSALRELQREVQICHKKLEQYEEDARNKKMTKINTSSPTRSSTSSLNSNPDNPLQVDIAPGNLVDKILKLQSEVTKLQEKIEFLEDHNASLLEQLQKKGRLLHSYILREQAGALTNQASDFHKVEMSRHGGIMASVYGSKSSDEGMTLELSLEINHKLQAILEDTLLKNITLKENIDTLGDEIDRLKKMKN